MDLLDIGGGFPGSEETELKFEEVLCLLSFFVLSNFFLKARQISCNISITS